MLEPSQGAVVFDWIFAPSGVGEEIDCAAGLTERDRMLLEIDLGSVVMGIGKRADQEEPHRR
jgi:hypothetical protein